MKETDQNLLNAANNGDIEKIKKLITQGANPNCMDRHGNTPLSNAVWQGNIASMKLLIQFGANIENTNKENYGLLCHAAFNAQVDSVQWLIDKGVDINQVMHTTAENALHFTISKKNNPKRTEIVKLLVRAGIDVNARTIPGKETGCFMREAYTKGETPLHRAAAFGDKKMIKFLLDFGADPSIRDAYGDSPISWGSWHLRPNEILELLVFGDVPGWYGNPNPNLKVKDLI